MKSALSLILFLCIIISSNAQNTTLAKFKLEEAQQAILKKDYLLTLDNLAEAEKQFGTVNQELMYLRVMAQYGIVEKEPLKDYTLLTQLQQNSKFYLDNYQDLPGNKERYKRVYLIWDKFGKSLTANKDEFDAAVTRLEVFRMQQEKNKQELQAVRERIKKLEEEKRIKKEEYEKIRKQRTFGHVALRAGVGIPLNADSKSMISVEEYNNAGGGPSQPFRRGKFGLNMGYSIGLQGIAPLEFINKEIQKGSLHPTFGFGVSVDLNQTLMRYNWRDLDQEHNDSYFIFREAKYGSFGITSIGIGPAVSFRPSAAPVYFDLYFRPDFNLIWGGRFYVNTTMPASGGIYEITSKRVSTSSCVGTSMGINFRFKRMSLGLEVRSGIEDDAEFRENYIMKNPFSGGYFSRVRQFSTPVLILDNASFRFGYVL